MKQPAFPSELFNQFGRHRLNVVRKVETSNVVAYTRVSDKDQEKNMSLENQLNGITEYANRSNLNITAFFGGRYESAKTDGRKEFNRMLTFIKDKRNKVSTILVYHTDRFSRSGASAIAIVAELREKYGIAVFAVMQPTNSFDPNGRMQQNMQLIFSEYDNELRKSRVVAGMTQKYQKGIWLSKPPQGYDVVKINGDRKIVVNSEGKKLRKAFEWKLQGLKNVEIISRLNTLGINMYPQRLCKMFANPFYCGLVAHGLLEGKVVEGSHERIITQEEFLRINEINQSVAQYGIAKEKENDNVPLRLFIRCSKCNIPFTGYIVRKKGLYYYKCRTKGCKCNKSAKQIHGMFMELLDQFSINPIYSEALLYDMVHFFEGINKSDIEREKLLKGQLTELNKKIEAIEEKYFVTEEMSKEIFDKFHLKYTTERNQLAKEMSISSNTISNLESALKTALQVCTNISEMWASGSIKVKERIQGLIFPEGIIYDREKQAFRTERVNLVFAQIAQLARALRDKKKGFTTFSSDKSLLVARRGIEPLFPG